MTIQIKDIIKHTVLCPDSNITLLQKKSFIDLQSDWCSLYVFCDKISRLSSYLYSLSLLPPPTCNFSLPSLCCNVRQYELFMLVSYEDSTLVRSSMKPFMKMSVEPYFCGKKRNTAENRRNKCTKVKRQEGQHRKCFPAVIDDQCRAKAWDTKTHTDTSTVNQGYYN